MRPSPAADGPRPSLPELKVELQNGARARVARSLLEGVATEVVRAEGLQGPLLVSVHLLQDSAVRAVNRERRGVDAGTDVLAFPLLARLQPGDPTFPLPPGVPCHLGDVLISYPRARAQAAEYGHSVEREVCYLLAHGILHLLGYDHLHEAERREMRLREEAALRPFGLTR